MASWPGTAYTACALEVTKARSWVTTPAEAQYVDTATNSKEALALNAIVP